MKNPITKSQSYVRAWMSYVRAWMLTSYLSAVMRQVRANQCQSQPIRPCYHPSRTAARHQAARPFTTSRSRLGVQHGASLQPNQDPLPPEGVFSRLLSSDTWLCATQKRSSLLLMGLDAFFVYVCARASVRMCQCACADVWI